MSPTLTFSIMGAAAVGLLLARWRFRRTGARWGRPVATILGLVAVAMAFYAIGDAIFGWSTKAESALRAKREQQYVRLGYEQLGDYLASNYPHAKALVITNAPPSGPEQLALAALKAGVAGRLELSLASQLSDPPLPDPDSATTTPPPQTSGPPLPAVLPLPDRLLTAKDWDTLLQTHAAATMVISLAGLPLDFDKMKLWQGLPAAHPVVVLANVQQISLLYHAITNNRIQVVLQALPTTALDDSQPIPDDPHAAFNRRWLLLTPAAIAAQRQAHRTLFMSAGGDTPAAALPTTAAPSLPPTSTSHD